MKRILYLFATVLLLTACEKELSQEGVIIIDPTVPDPKPEPVDTTVTFQLTAYYSDIPIDFDESDAEVRSETDLWRYVFDYLKDDHYIFHTDSTVDVVQHEMKMPGSNDPIFYRYYSIGTDINGEYMIYLTADYKQTKYRLHEMNEDYFILGLKWKDGARVYSRFDRVK